LGAEGERLQRRADEHSDKREEKARKEAEAKAQQETASKAQQEAEAKALQETAAKEQANTQTTADLLKVQQQKKEQLLAKIAEAKALKAIQEENAELEALLKSLESPSHSELQGASSDALQEAAEISAQDSISTVGVSSPDADQAF